MNWLDIVIIISLIISLVSGLTQGLIRSAFALAGLIGGIILATNLYKPLGHFLSFIPDERIANIVAFAIILIIVLIIAALLGSLFKRLISMVMLGWFDHLGGAVFGVLSGLVFWAVLLAILEKYTGWSVINGSAIARTLLENFPVVLSFIPEAIDNLWKPAQVSSYTAKFL